MPSVVTTIAPAPSPTADETNSYCGKYHLVEPNEDCGTVTTQFEIALDDFLFLNPKVWDNCTNLLRDYYYCVRPVGYITTYPGHAASPTTKPFEQTPSTHLPVNPLANYSSSRPVIPFANETRKDCYSYITFENVTDNDAADCWNLATVLDTTPEELVLWNPSLGENSTTVGPPTTLTFGNQIIVVSSNAFAYPCTLSANASYCVAVASPTSSTANAIQTPNPRAAGQVANCTSWFAPTSTEENCSVILNTFLLTFDEFYAMNPAVRDDCSGLLLGTYYCISTYPDGFPAGQPDWTGSTVSVTISPTSTTATSTPTSISTPSPVQTGIVASCTEFYQVAANDTCYDIALDHDVPLQTFYEWNPAVQSNCSGLQGDVYVCVGVEAGSATTTVTSTTNGFPTPTPTQQGMVRGCEGFYFVQAGDSCYDVAAAEGIALDDFYAWNPAVKGDCSGLQAGVYVCVSV